MSAVFTVMPIKPNIIAGTAQYGRYALSAPRPGDTISGALCQAFETPVEEDDFSVLLARIDRADKQPRAN